MLTELTHPELETELVVVCTKCFGFERNCLVMFSHFADLDIP